jgi:hypothetical protein
MLVTCGGAQRLAGQRGVYSMFVPSCTRFLADLDHPTQPRAEFRYVAALVQPVRAEYSSKRKQGALEGQNMTCFCCCLVFGEWMIAHRQYASDLEPQAHTAIIMDPQSSATERTAREGDCEGV